MSQELLYGIVNSKGELIAVTDDERDAVKDAQKVARSKEIGLIQSAEEALPRENVRRITGKEPQVALKNMWITPVKMRDVMKYSPKEAWEALQGVYGEGLAPKSFWKNKERSVAYTVESLATSNAKLDKRNLEVFEKMGISMKQGRTKYSGISTWGLALAPNTVAWDTPIAPAPLVEVRDEMLGITKQRKPNLCVYASPECRAGCLVSTGQNAMGGYDRFGNKVEKGSVPAAALGTYYAKVRRTLALYENPEAFCRLLVNGIDLRKCETQAAGDLFMFRLNIYSDIPWELFFPELFTHFKDVQFYDYTKIPSRKPPKNYNLTFSYSGMNKVACDDHLNRGGGVTVVTFAGKDAKQDKRALYQAERVKSIWGYPTLNGDINDARPLDKQVLKKLYPNYDGGYCISLMYKMPRIVDTLEGGLRQAKDLGAFVVDVVYDKENDVFIAPQTPNQTIIKDK